MYQSFYQDFLSANAQLIHMAAHSHHYWPDVVKDAVLESYEDSRNLVDLKWEKILGEVVPKSQRLIARILNLDHPEQIAFASNTHELLARLLSCFDPAKKLRILTTDSEFHSASRQFKRLDELENLKVTYIRAGEDNFEEVFLKEIKTGSYDFIFLSHVFYNTGKKLRISDIEAFVAAKNEEALFCLDGYHSFCAIPSDLKSLQDKIFFLAGSYKYAQAGEGMCFMTIPKDCQLRPINTGWFASFDDLEKEQDQVGYAVDGWRFAGSTRDFTAHYRFNKVWETLLDQGLDIAAIHRYIQELQKDFLTGNPLTELFTNTNLTSQGHFLVLDNGSSEKSRQLHLELKNNQILTDYRGHYLRFGFGLYLSLADVKKVRAFLNSPAFTKMALK